MFISTLDTSLTLAINSCHSPFFDNFFYIYTQTWTWIPAILVLLVWMWRKWGVRSLYVVAGIALCILLSDQISSSLLKPLVARLRPTHNPEIADLIHIVNGYRGGRYGFVSSHAANAATFVTFTALIFRNRYYSILLSLWAFLTAYSRVYLGVHYVGDVLCGALIGVLVGMGVYFVLKPLLSKGLNGSRSRE
ncbi:MAG: phosphatase PAP2 family protein [Paludibacteraceae bacterium]|nr:phosphatase PAP2 family protein [Paludibacteraceae bacterium]